MKTSGIEKLEEIVNLLRKKAAESVKNDNVSVAVGFQTNYAIYVHENMQAKHPVGQAKFLEQPARELQRDELPTIATKALQQRKTMGQALLLAGLRLQRESQKLVPVDTGALKNSAFTTLEEGR